MLSPATLNSESPFRAGCRAARAHGFTIIEMMITVTVLGILSAVALPSLSTFVRDQKVKAATSDVYASIIFARSEAIKRNQNVAICASTDGTGCANSANWATGWIVFVDTDGDGLPAAVADIVKKQGANDVTLTGTATNLSYRRDGRLAATVTDFTVSATGVSTARCVRIGVSGRPNIKVGC